MGKTVIWGTEIPVKISIGEKLKNFNNINTTVFNLSYSEFSLMSTLLHQC